MDKESQKLKKLEKILKKLKSVVVAYSAGVDSNFLLKISSLVLGKDNVLAVTARSQTYPQREYEQALRTAKDFDVRHISINSNELKLKKFRENSTDRCYHCKRELFSQLKKIAQKERLGFVVDGTTFDDLMDFRPGMKAASELEVHSPLKEAGLTKDNVRQLSRKLKLDTWNKPAGACLASRFPYHHRITAEKLKQVEKAETLLRELSFEQVRVRHYGESSRIEVGKNEINKFNDRRLRDKVVNAFKKIGFVYVTLDLEGYRSGSMNETFYKRYSLDEKQAV